MDKDNRKIYIVIGFPKCGTSSLHKYFLNNNVKSSHYLIDNVSVGLSIQKHKYRSELLLSEFPNIDAFTQIDWSGINNMVYPQLTDLEILIEQYPNAKFILNLRNVYDWVRSVNNWNNLRQRYIESELPYLPKGKGNLDEDLIQWYNNHIERTKNIFKNKNKENKLFILNIDDPNMDELNKFCDLYNVTKFPNVNVNKKN